MDQTQEHTSMSEFLTSLSSTVLEGRKMYYHPQDRYIGKSLENGAWWEKELNDVAVKLISQLPGTTVLDLGANIGTFCIDIADRVQREIVVEAFEPIYYPICLKNIQENKTRNQVHLHNYAISEKDGDSFEVNTVEQISEKIGNPNQGINLGGFSFHDCASKTTDSQKRSLTVTSRTLDSFNFEDVCFIKMDVEGFEFNALQGGKGLFQQKIPVIWVEMWSCSDLVHELVLDKGTYTYRGMDLRDAFFKISCFMFDRGYVLYPIIPKTDDFLFIHRDYLSQAIKCLA